MGAFQAMLSLLLHFVGSPFSEETATPEGPRQVGQFSANKTEVDRATRTTAKSLMCSVYD